MKYRIKIDGGSKPNPGDSACGAVVYLEEHPIPVLNRSKWLGPNITNNVAEHEGLVLALETAIELNATAVEIESDSKVAVNHFNGGWKVNDPQLAHLVKRERSLAARLRKVQVTWVGRANVFPAHYLVDNCIWYNRAFPHAKDGRSRLFLDVHKFIYDNGVFLLQKTDFCFITPKLAVVPIWDCVGQNNKIFPCVSSDVFRDIKLLREEMPVLLAWRPYGQGRGAKPAHLIPSKRPLRAWQDGGVELLFCFSDYYSDDELLPSYTGERKQLFLPASDMVWWSYD